MPVGASVMARLNYGAASPRWEGLAGALGPVGTGHAASGGHFFLRGRCRAQRTVRLCEGRVDR